MGIQTLPDERAETISDADIASHEAAREEAAKVAVNPANEFFATVRGNLDQINKDMSFGISYSQRARNEHARETAATIFFDVQLQDAMAGLGMASDSDLVLAVNRLKSLQKLYLFEQKGGEDYLGF